MTKPSEVDLYEALHTACGLLEMTAWETDDDGVQVCATCDEEWYPDDVGCENDHAVACDIPDVFAVRDAYRAEIEREEREKEFGQKCRTCDGTQVVGTGDIVQTMGDLCMNYKPCPDCRPKEVERKFEQKCETCDGSGEIDNRLGGESFMGVSTCPDCDGTGELQVDG